MYIYRFSEPETVRNVTHVVGYEESITYKANVTVSYSPPCALNGRLENYNLTLKGTRPGFPDHDQPEKTTAELFVFQLRPDYEYVIVIEAFNGKLLGHGFQTEAFKAPPGGKTTASCHGAFLSPQNVVPLGASDVVPPVADGTTTATFVLSNQLFDDTNGDILYYVFVLSSVENNRSVGNVGFWDGTSWPDVFERWEHEGDVVPYQVTNRWWNPFDGTLRNVFRMLAHERN